MAFAFTGLPRKFHRMGMYFAFGRFGTVCPDSINQVIGFPQRNIVIDKGCFQLLDFIEAVQPRVIGDCAPLREGFDQPIGQLHCGN